MKGKEPNELIGGLAYVGKDCTLNVYGGNLSTDLPSDKSRSINRGGVVYSEGELNLVGGVITGADVGYNGGAIYIGEDGSFNMSGGILRHGSAYKQD